MVAAEGEQKASLHLKVDFALGIIVVFIIVIIIVIIIMITRPKPAYGRQGLAAYMQKAGDT